jgi:hypothetical protein
MATSAEAIQDAGRGQRLMIAAIGVNIAAYIIWSNVGPVAGVPVGLLALGVAGGGVLRVTGALGYSTPRKVIYLVGLLIPVIALIALALLSSEATKVLRANGYEVGLFGAKGF